MQANSYTTTTPQVVAAWPARGSDGAKPQLSCDLSGSNSSVVYPCLFHNADAAKDKNNGQASHYYSVSMK